MSASRSVGKALGVLIALATAGICGAAETPDASALLADLARPAPSEVRYLERRLSAVLLEPIYTEGSMSRPEPAVLAKTVEGDRPQSMRIAGGKVEVLQTGKPTRRFSLNRAPGLGLLAASFDALLGGDAAAIADEYRMQVDGSDEAWQLTLTPIDARLAKRVSGLVLFGGNGEWRCFDMLMGKGESSRLWLGESAAQAQSAASDEARDAICTLAATPQL